MPGLDSQSHVEHDAAVWHASDGVEVRLDHLRELPEQEREAQHQLAQRLSIEHRAAAEPVQLSGDAVGGVDQLVGFCVGYRQQAERAVRNNGTKSAVTVIVPEAAGRWRPARAVCSRAGGGLTLKVPVDQLV